VQEKSIKRAVPDSVLVTKTSIDQDLTKCVFRYHGTTPNFSLDWITLTTR
jgi:hypothetical protein